MYQNYNYNYKEYEILGIGGRDYQPRYPLAQAPNAELQQMSYKDWMNRCAGVESGELFDADAVKTMLLIGTGISWAILGVAFPPLSVAVGILNVMISYLWPSQATEDQFSWKQMMSATEQLINQAINPIIKSKAIDALRDLHSSLRDYNQALCNLQTNLDSPDVERYKEVVRREFNDANDKAKSTIINLESDGFQIQFLSSYAQAANIHLLLLKDVKQYGEIWGLTALEVEQYFDNPPSKPGNPGMIQLIEIYTDYCINWYNRGLQQQAETYYWNGFNDFRRTMTIVVLDIVALWPTYNPINYPKPVKAQLTRTVYTPTFGQHIASSKVLFDELELSLVTPPQLFTFLDAVTFYRRDDELTQYAGIMQTLRYTSSLSLFQTIQGQRTDLVDNIRIYSGVLDEVWKTASVVGELDNTSSMNIQTFSFYLLSNPENPVTIGHVYSSNTTAATYGFPCVATNISCIGEPCTPCSISQPLESICNIPNKASHLLVSVTANVQNHIRLASYGWNHLSADANNLLDAEKITQIPAVKGVRMLSNVSVVKGPGSTGGDLVKMSNGDGVFSISITSSATNERVSGYAIRLRYASNADTNFQIFMATKGQPMIVSDQIIPSTSFDNSLTYQAFDYYTLSEFELKTLPEVKQDTFFDFFKRGAGDILIDKIEFIPIEGSLEEYKANQALEKARKAVNTLFTSDAKTVLKLNVTDYAVDQAANLVECVSEEFHAQEKMILLDQVKVAKRLSQTRNLLNYGDFESPDWSGENGWKTNHHVHVASDNPIFKGRYLHMPGVTNSQFSNNVYPTYAYQKVDESKLKSYTRYLVRGFVGNSKDLELLVERYGKDVHVEMDVPNDIRYSLPMNECGGFDRCKPELYQGRPLHTCTCKDTTSVHTDCQYQNKVNRTSVDVYTNGSPSRNMYADGFHSHKSCGCKNNDMYPNGTDSHKSCRCKDPHVFTYHIDTGCVDQEENLGLWFALKIASENGVANIDNLEIIEAQPLTGEALARVKKREQKWKKEVAKKRLETKRAVQAAQGAIQLLFTNAQYNRLQFETLFPQIVRAEKLVEQIPYVYHPFLSEALLAVPGMNFDIVQQLSALVDRARGLYDLRNLVQNGTFSSGTGSWHVSEGVTTHPEGNTSVLVLSEWNHEASQQLRIDPDRGYVLRVTARKEGAGKGTVTMNDCADYTETLTFTSCDYNTIGTQTMPGSTLSGFVTKTLEIFLDTDRIRIAIGETEGTFKIESVELICMEQMENHLYEMAGNLEEEMQALEGSVAKFE